MTLPAAADRTPVPRDPADDYTRDAARLRQEFLTQRSGTALDHVGHYSLDPATLPGNIEHFFGVAQVPIGVAGPLLVNGEHAQGSSTFRWPRPKARSWPPTTAA